MVLVGGAGVEIGGGAAGRQQHQQEEARDQRPVPWRNRARRTAGRRRRAASQAGAPGCGRGCGAVRRRLRPAGRLRRSPAPGPRPARRARRASRPGRRSRRPPASGSKASPARRRRRFRGGSAVTSRSSGPVAGCAARIRGEGLRPAGRRRQPLAARGVTELRRPGDRCTPRLRARPRPARPSEARVRFQRLRVLFALVVREMSTKFGRSYGGYIWAIAEPLGGIMLLNLAFSLTVRRPPLGTNFPLFYATGIMPFFLFTGVSGRWPGDRHQPRAAALSGGLAARRGVRQVHPDFLTMFIIGVLLSTGIILLYALPVTLDPAAALQRLPADGAARARVRHAELRALRLLADLAQHLERADQAALPRCRACSTSSIRCRAGPGDPLVEPARPRRSAWSAPASTARLRPTTSRSPTSLAVSGSLFVVGAYLLRRHASWLIEKP